MDFDIVPCFGHYEIYINGEFYCTADTYCEAEREIENIVKEDKNYGSTLCLL